MNSTPGDDGFYATGDTITVGLTFSEEIVVTGDSYLLLDIGGQLRRAAYNGEISSPEEMLFSYTVLVGDRDTDGIAVVANSLSIESGAIQSEAGSGDALLAHHAKSFVDHKVDTDVLLISTLNEGTADNNIVISESKGVVFNFAVSQHREFDITEVILDIRSPSDTLVVSVSIASVLSLFGEYTYSGSVDSVGLQSFTLDATQVRWANILAGTLEFYEVEVRGSGSGSIEIAARGAPFGVDDGGVEGLSFDQEVHRDAIPKVALVGHEGAIPYIVHGGVISSPLDGESYRAGERIDFSFLFSREVKGLDSPLLPFWLGNGAQHLRQARLIVRNERAMMQKLVFSYIVQPGDLDTDGIYLPPDPLGDNAGVEVALLNNKGIPADLRLADNQTGPTQSVDGKEGYGCREVLCSRMTAEREGEYPDTRFGASINDIASANPYSPLGDFTASTFEYAGDEYAVLDVWEYDDYFFVVTFELINLLWLRTAPAVTQEMSERLGLLVGDEVFALNEADHAYGFGFEWTDPGLGWQDGDLIDVKLVEMSTASFPQESYAKQEGDSFEVTVTLGDAFTETTLILPLVTTLKGDATAADFTGIPRSLVFEPGETAKSFTVHIVDDVVADDGESIIIGLGADHHIRAGGAHSEVLIEIEDNDDPGIEVAFAQGTYTAIEGYTQTVTVTLSGESPAAVTIPINKTNHGAEASDYSGVPQSVTFEPGETSESFTFSATEDSADDDGERVTLTFGTLPEGVFPGTPGEATITIRQPLRQARPTCDGALWCADLRFADVTAEDWGWAFLRYGPPWTPPASLSEDTFAFRGVNYTIRHVVLQSVQHPTLPNAWSRWQKGYANLTMVITHGETRQAPPGDHFRDWVLHIDDVRLPMKDASVSGSHFRWQGVQLDEMFAVWTPATINEVTIEEVSFASQPETPAVPGAPMQVDAWAAGSESLRVMWVEPLWSVGLPEPTGYTVQWKAAGDNWSDPAGVCERRVSGPGSSVVDLDGLTEGALYSIRVIATNAVGAGTPSLETLGRPQSRGPDLVSAVIDGDVLTMGYDRTLDARTVPDTGSFVVLVEQGLRTVEEIAIVGNEVRLTLDRPVSAANTVAARYETPTDPDAAFLRDTEGNHVVSLKAAQLAEVDNQTAPELLQPLIAEFTNVPTFHDGATAFSFNIVFSESVWVGMGFPRSSLLVVTGGTVTQAHWLDRRTDRWEVTILPDTVGDITVTLPGRRNCVVYGVAETPGDDLVAGAPCAAGDRMLTNEPTVIIRGR